MKKNTKSALPIADFIVVIIFSCIAAFSINLFRIDLLQTISSRNVEPVGIVIIKRNIVQRRLEDRVLWDRLTNESPVYPGDLIRVTEHSAATLHIEGNSIDLNENTLIRITRSPNNESLQIVMSEGNLSITTTEVSGLISLNINSREIQPVAGMKLNVTSAGTGTRLQVIEGEALLIEEGHGSKITAGSFVAITDDGFSLEDRAVAVINPVYNAHYLNTENAPFAVDFLWNKINLDSDELLRLEIASDANYKNILHVYENLDRQAQAALTNGPWYWRLSCKNPTDPYLTNTVLDEGRLMIIDGSGPQLQSPAPSSVFRIKDESPVLYFNWDKAEEASSYILEVCDTPDFSAPQIRRQSQVAFFTLTWLANSNLGPGTWYWRVMSVFPPVYMGSPSFSQVNYFRVEQAAAQAAAQTAEAQSLSEWLAAEIPPELIPIPEPVAPVLLLTAPAHRAGIDGLTALRQRTVFTWECEGEITRARLYLSRNPDPFIGQPAAEIQNPGRSISVNTPNEGTWYWNIEAQTANGFTVRAAENRVLRITPVPLLSAPVNLQPARGQNITMRDLQARRNIGFSWQAVQGANAYIITILQQTAGGRRQIFRSQPQTRTSYLFDDLRLLDKGTFIWQVEALNRRANGTIDQRGNIAESSFIMDIVLPGPILIDGSGVVE